MGLPSISTVARLAPYSTTRIFAPAGIIGRLRQFASLIRS
jgi:hypothetical protein